MDAQLVWNTWRRVLTSDDLADRVRQPGSTTDEPTGLTADELAILAEYAATPVATESNIGMYRRGLVRNALGALDLVPLSRQLLHSSGLDPEAVAADCTRAAGYPDHGPNFWQAAAEFVDHLAGLPELAAPARQDVLAIDAATIALARRLGQSAPTAWPDTTDSATDPSAHQDWTRFVASSAAVVVASQCDLTSWIENPFSFEASDQLDRTPRHWLIYFPDAEASPEYAALSERAARTFTLLATPASAAELAPGLGLTPAEALAVIGSLAGLGVVRSEAAVPAQLPDEAFVLLDPAVEVLAVEQHSVEIAEHRLLCHGHYEIGMVVPPGDGLLAFVTALADQPSRVGGLRARFDDQKLIDAMLAALHQHGFLHVTEQAHPSDQQLTALRKKHEAERVLRHTIELDLDQGLPIEQLVSQLNPPGPAPQVLLRGIRLADHQAVLAELARLRQDGRLRLHDTVVQSQELSGDRELASVLNRLGATVRLAAVSWPAPADPVPGIADVAELAGHCVPVQAVQAPDLSILDAQVRSRALHWAAAQFISGLCLQLDPATLWPAGEAEEADFIEVFEAVRAIEDQFGDVQILNLPSDEVLLGNSAALPRPERPTGLADRFRLAYLRWRLPILKGCENDNSWSQLPEVEDKLIRASDDLLPNHPELLGLQPGSVLVDVCGGLGRVARRLSPAVGPDGLVISIEMFRCLSDRARRFAQERGITNLQFRPGLAQRLPLPAASADAAVNEWTGAIWELGIGPAMIAEMARVVRPGGRIAITHRLVQLQLSALGQPWVQYEQIYQWIREAFDQPGLAILTERIWGQIVPSLVGQNATLWRKQYLPRLVNPFDLTYQQDANPDTCADVYLTIIAQRQ